jgi:hypothetical protein
MFVNADKEKFLRNHILLEDLPFCLLEECKILTNYEEKF